MSQTSGAKMIRKAYPAYGYKVIRVRGQANLDSKNSELDVIFRILFELLFEPANSFWL